MYHEPEISALSDVYEALKRLNHPQLERVIDWVTSKFSLDENTGEPVIKEGRPGIPGSPPVNVIEVVDALAEPIKKRRGRKPGIARVPGKTNRRRFVSSLGIEGFMKYNTLQEVFSVSKTKKISAKILLAAAFLYESRNMKEITSYDISSNLKKIGEPIKNVSLSIRGLMSKKQPLLLQTGTMGDSTKSRKKFRITEEGLKLARNFLQ